MILRNRQTKGGGILIAIKQKSGVDYTVIKIDQENEIIWIKCKTNNYSFIIATVYGLQESQTNEERIDDWYYHLEEQYSKWNDEPVLLIGDFNAHVGNDHLGISGNTSKINTNGRKLREMIDRRNLILLNDTNLCQGKWTRVDKSNQSKSIIDLAVCNENMISKIKEMIVDEDRKYVLTRVNKKDGKYVEIPSDHNSIFIEIEGEKLTKNPKITTWNVSNTADQKRFNKITENVQMKEQWKIKGDIDVKYKKWYNQIVSIMHKSFKKSTIKPGQNNKTVRQLSREKRKLKSEMQRLEKIGQRGVVYNFFDEKQQSLIQKIAEENEREKLEKTKIRLQRILDQGQDKKNEIWKVRKDGMKSREVKLAIKTETGKLLTNKDDICRRYIEYYKDLLQPRPPNSSNVEYIKEIEQTFSSCLKTKAHDNDSINLDFNMEELETVIKSTKPRKCPGPDEIPTEIIIHAGTNLKKSLLHMINYFWKYEEIPSMLREINIKTLYKGKGSTEDLKNQRGIFLSNEVLTIYEKLIHNRARPRIEEKISQWQAGGRPNRSISDQLFILRSIMNHYQYMGLDVILELLDLVKAFDKMELKAVLLNLWNTNVKGKIWRTIYLINNKSTLTIKTAFGTTDAFEVGETIKQGSVLATTLAALHTDTVTKLFANKALSLKYGNIKIENLLFQDDILKIQENEEDLNKANKVYETFQNNNRLQFHEDKSVWMSSSKQPITIMLNNKELKRATEQKYLGDIICSNNKYDSMIETRKNAARGATAELNTILNETSLNEIIKTVKAYYQAVITPKLLLNSETWSSLTVKNQADLEIAQNISVKRLIRLPVTTPSQILRSELGIWSVRNQIIYKQLMYLQRLLKMKNNVTRDILIQQETIPGKTWLSEIFQQIENLNIKLKLNQIQNLSKQKWKSQLKTEISNKEKDELKQYLKNSKKGKYIEASNISFKKYLSHLNYEEAITILKIRTGMLDIKANYKQKYNSNLKCDMCKTETENFDHFMVCNSYKTPKIEDRTVWKLCNIQSSYHTLSKAASLIIQRLTERGAVQSASDCDSDDRCQEEEGTSSTSYEEDNNK